MEDIRYIKRSVGNRRVDAEGRHPMTIRAQVDNLGMINLELGTNLILRMDVENTEKLLELVVDSLEIMKDESWPPKAGRVEIFEDRVKQIHNARKSAVDPSGNSKGRATVNDGVEKNDGYVDPLGLCPNDPVKW